MTTDAPWNDPDVRDWMEDARVNLIPLIADANSVASLVPSTLNDVKFALELGLSLMMDKPIIAVVLDDRPVPAKLLLVADEVVRLTKAEMQTKVGRDRVYAAIDRLAPDEED
jgi:hypothetical protein